VQLLSDVKAIFDMDGGDRLPSVNLVQRLGAIEGGLWGEFRDGHALTTHQLARLLRAYNVQVKTVRIDAQRTAKGYLRDDFSDAWRRYVRPLVQASDGNSVTDGASPNAQSLTQLSTGYRVTDPSSDGRPITNGGHARPDRTVRHTCAVCKGTIDDDLNLVVINSRFEHRSCPSVQ
jgi:hypothetical protein